MPHNEDKLTPADPRDLAEAVALALRFFEGRNRNRDADAFRAALAARSGPTKGAKPNTDSSADINSNGSKENSAGVTAGPKSTGGAQPVTPITPEKKQ